MLANIGIFIFLFFLILGASGHLRGRTGLSASIPRPIPYVYSGAGKNPGKLLVESASAIFDTLWQRIPNIFPVSSPAPLYTYRRVSTEEEVEYG
jgi:hypothetical protein